MSEEEKKEIPNQMRNHWSGIIGRIVSIIALVASYVTFSCGLMLFHLILWSIFFRHGAKLTHMVAVFNVLAVAWYPMTYFTFVIGIGLVLSIVTLFIEHNRFLRLLPLTLVLIGILLYAACFLLFF